MLILLMSDQDTANPKLSTWLAELGRSVTVVLAMRESATPEQIDSLLAAAKVNGGKVATLNAPFAEPAPAAISPTQAPTTVPETVAEQNLAEQLAALTGRQREVLILVGKGLSNKMIAIKIGTAVENVRGDMKRIFRALGVNNRTAAAVVQNTRLKTKIP